MNTEYIPKHRADVPVDAPVDAGTTWAVLIRTAFDAPWTVLTGLTREQAAAEIRAYSARGVTAWAEER